MTGVNCLMVMPKPFDSHLPLASRDGRLVVAAGPRPLERAKARLRSRRLDQALARGATSEATPALAVRARCLIALPQRRSIAETYRRIVSEARRGGTPSLHRVTPSRTRVTAAGDELIRLADALTQPGPVAARGVAEALLLLADGTGPLYNPATGISLEDSAARATTHLALMN
jgi:hypothetical protein